MTDADFAISIAIAEDPDSYGLVHGGGVQENGRLLGIARSVHPHPDFDPVDARKRTI